MLLLCAAPGLQFRIRVRHEPMFAESTTLYAEDEPGNTLGRAKVEVTGIQGGKGSGHPDAVQRPLLTGMFVDPEHRRRGVARRLLREAEEQVAAWGFDELLLHVQQSNSAAASLYASAGYEPDEPGTAVLVDGTWVESRGGSWWERWWRGQSYVMLRKPLPSDSESSGEAET